MTPHALDFVHRSDGNTRFINKQFFTCEQSRALVAFKNCHVDHGVSEYMHTYQLT